VNFRNANVTLFKSEVGQDAQRVPKTTLPVPSHATVGAGNSDRLQIMTLDGVRWVALSDVEVDVHFATRRRSRASYERRAR